MNAECGMMNGRPGFAFQFIIPHSAFIVSFPSFSQNVPVPVPHCALAPELAADRVELFFSDDVFRLVKEPRKSVESRSAPVRLIECRARLSLRQSVAAEESRRFKLSETERRRFDH